LALIWLYLQIIGAPVERLMLEEDLWTFDRNDFEKACIFLVFNVTGKNFTRQDQRHVFKLILAILN